MATTTSPDALYVAEGTDAPDFAAIIAALANSVQTALNGVAAVTSNSNGKSWRFRSGLQIAILNTTSTMAINTANGTGYITASPYTWTFPQAFVSAPVVLAPQFAWGTGASWGSVVQGTTATAGYLRGHSLTALASGTVSIGVIAVGAWK